MIKITITQTGAQRVLLNTKRLIGNLPKTSNKISYLLAKRIEKRAKETLMKGEYHNRKRGGALVMATTAQKVKDGQWTVTSGGEATTIPTVHPEYSSRGAWDYAIPVNYGAGPHLIPNAFGLGIVVQHPGIYKSSTIGYFDNAVEQTRQEAKMSAESEVKSTIKQSGW